MPAKKKSQEYASKATTTMIRATSRISSKMPDDNFYTLEYTEERQVLPDADLVKEREILWDIVNGEVDGMVKDTYDMIKTEQDMRKKRYKK